MTVTVTVTVAVTVDCLSLSIVILQKLSNTVVFLNLPRGRYPVS